MKEDRRGRGPEKIEVKDRRRVSEDGDVLDASNGGNGAPDDGDADGIALSETVPLEHLEAEKRRAEQAEARVRDYAEAYQRNKTEFEAVRARLERDQGSRVRAALGETFDKIVPVLDDLARALEFADESPLAEGMKMVAARLEAVFADAGLVPVDVVGQPFDPAVADAVAVVPVDDEDANNIVVEQVRRGWRFGDQILRPAQVHVGRYSPAAGADGPAV